MFNADPNHKVFNTLEEAVRFFCRHLVSLSGWYQAVNSDGIPFGQTHFFSYSGFVISIQGVWNFVTAGHILLDLEEQLEKKTIKVHEYVLVDRFAPGAKSPDPIPFDYAKAHKLPVYDEEAGLDFGLIILSRYYCDLLKANGIVPVIEENWKNIPDELSDKYVMLGLPQQLIKTRVVSKIGKSGVVGSVSPAAVAIERLHELPDDILATNYPRFIGKFYDAKYQIEDITGMSGGPIIGFNKEWSNYWIVAVQSSWLPQRKITFGCLVSVFAQLVDDWLSGPEP